MNIRVTPIFQGSGPIKCVCFILFYLILDILLHKQVNQILLYFRIFLVTNLAKLLIQLPIFVKDLFWLSDQFDPNPNMLAVQFALLFRKRWNFRQFFFISSSMGWTYRCWLLSQLMAICCSILMFLEDCLTLSFKECYSSMLWNILEHYDVSSV